MADLNVVTLSNFIGGKFTAPDNGAYIDSFDPSTNDINARVPDSGETDVISAVKAAKDAFKSWSNTSLKIRSKILTKVADIIESRLEEFAQAESRDQGKPIWMPRTVDIPRVVDNFRHFAQTALNDTDMAIGQPDGVFNYTVQSPIGVAAVISPWNFPLHLLTFKLAPALIYGNTVVAKPSEFTSVTASMLCKVFQEAGLPDGVVNMVFGYGPRVGEPLVRHPDVKLVSFTGSTRTGTKIAEMTASQAKKLSLEMGGKNAAIVFEDADIDNAATTLIRGAFLNSGQVCLCLSRIYVHRSIYEKFVEKYSQLAKKIVVGPPCEESSFLGPVNNRVQYDKIRSYIEIAKREKAVFLIGEEQKLDLPPKYKHGFFIAPVILTDLKRNSRLMTEEVFGPLTCLTVFDDEDEVIEMANESDYGLCASIFSSNVSRIHRVAPKLEAGTIWCNCWMVRNMHMPFGGVKMSGIGREGTHASREFFTEQKTICLKL